MSGTVELVCDAGDLCGEAPLWWEDEGTLSWADQAQGIFRRLDRDAASARWGFATFARGFAAGGAVRSSDGGVIVTGPDGLAALDRQGTLRRVPVTHRGRLAVLNDACAGSDGVLYAGTMALTADASALRAPGALVRVDGNEAVDLDEDVLLPNGMAFAPDDACLYVVDSARRQILAYPTDELRRTRRPRRRVLVSFSPEQGCPDGLAVDEQGNLWVAMWYGGSLLQISPDGRIEHVVRLPYRQAVSVAFGGASGQDLFVTTAAAPWYSTFAPPGWTAGRAPEGGPLLRVRLELAGARRHRAGPLPQLAPRPDA